jgi:hypothetical protein
MAMKWTNFLTTILMVSVMMMTTISCGNSGGSSSDTSSASSNSSTVSDKYVAEDAVRRVRSGVYDGVLAKLSNGTFSSTNVNGTTGTASVTGTESSSTGVSCGTDCVRSRYDADVTVVFTNFKFNYASNDVVTLTGTVVYTEHSSSTQSGLSYSSSRSITIKSSGQVQYNDVITYSTGGSTYQDAVTFNASGSSEYNLSGTLANGAGATFSF